ncbi:MAG: M14 family zinc carboxypeptidase, partial [Nocardioidaceae bacterium]
MAEQIAERNPAILWVAGNVHGNEESGTDASLRVLYELAARTDCTASTILDKTIVVVMPMQNPDGREADTRRNDYGFDLNRDWFARTQPETDAKLEKLRELPPQVFVDAHEMGSPTFFFPPNADPVYHEIGESPLDWIYNLYGTAMQQAFDRFDIPYFNGSAYDLLYMGYGDTVPATGFNAAGMTFEKNNADPTEVRLREQYVAIWSTLMAAGGRDTLLSEWRQEHMTAFRQGLEGQLEPNQLYYEGTEIENPVPDTRVRHYFLRTDDPAKADEVQRLAARLQDMDVDVYRLARPLTVPDYTPYGQAARSTTLPLGTLWVPLAQGQKHWVQAMLHEDTYVPFPYFYDVTAWSGPLLENIAGGRSGAKLHPQAVELRPQSEPAPPQVADPPRLAVWQISEASSSIESAGWLRWWLDHEVDLDYTDVTAEQIAGGALADEDVLV